MVISLYSALGVGQDNEGQQDSSGKAEFHTAHKEELFPYKGSEAGEQLVQRCAISILEGLQGTSGTRPEQPGQTPELTLLGRRSDQRPSLTSHIAL